MFLKILMYLGIILLIIVIIIAILIWYAMKNRQNFVLAHIQGEKITTDARVIASEYRAMHTGSTINVTVVYTINDQVYENKILKLIDQPKDLFDDNKIVKIDVSKKDYNDIRFNLEWYHNIGAMLPEEIALRDKKNRW